MQLLKGALSAVQFNSMSSLMLWFHQYLFNTFFFVDFVVDNETEMFIEMQFLINYCNQRIFVHQNTCPRNCVYIKSTKFDARPQIFMKPQYLKIKTYLILY